MVMAGTRPHTAIAAYEGTTRPAMVMGTLTDTARPGRGITIPVRMDTRLPRTRLITAVTQAAATATDPVDVAAMGIPPSLSTMTLGTDMAIAATHA